MSMSSVEKEKKEQTARNHAAVAKRIKKKKAIGKKKRIAEMNRKDMFG